MENEFITRVRAVIEENLADEQFGVSELAGKMNMSRSNLLRKIRKLSDLSASQFIRNIRLENAREMLKDSSLTVSEISFKVGFGSTSYFIKCFREFYGYPPGEAGKREEEVAGEALPESHSKKKQYYIIGTVALALILVLAFFLLILPRLSDRAQLDKSIAVLPFINDSEDSTNVYIINGLMESILNNLQKIEDLRVVSRTSVEKYRHSPKLIPEIARELDVKYFVEGSGQKIGDQIMLSIQLIDGASDKHLWSAQYNREAKDIFKLQSEVARSIADRVQVILTPSELEQIDKVPTDNLAAYDAFLKGLEAFYRGTPEGLEEALPLFRHAVSLDDRFARAYADIAIIYYYFDLYHTEKLYQDSINKYADLALLNDPKLPQSLMAKAFYFMHGGSYHLAVPYLERALEYNPNSALAINTLADFYANYIPDSEKYLEYAVRGIRLDIAAQDSVTASFIFLHVSNAFIQSGFTREAEFYIDRSLDYNPANIYSAYVKAYILFAKNKDLRQTKDLLLRVLERDTNRLDVLQEVGKIYYYLRDYDSAYRYYERFDELRRSLGLDIYRGEDAKIGLVFSKVGLESESERLFLDFKDYAENDPSIYKHLSLAVFYSCKGNADSALAQFRLFSNEENYHYWTILFLGMDPLVDPIKNNPEFKKILNNIEDKFWKRHRQMKTTLEEKGLI